MGTKLKKLSIILFISYCLLDFYVHYVTFQMIGGFIFLASYFKSIISFGVLCAILFGIGTGIDIFMQKHLVSQKDE